MILIENYNSLHWISERRLGQKHTPNRHYKEKYFLYYSYLFVGSKRTLMLRLSQIQNLSHYKSLFCSRISINVCDGIQCFTYF